MTTRPASLKKRMEAFLLDILTWVSVLYAFDQIYENRYFVPGSWIGVFAMVGLNMFLMTRSTTLGKFILDLKVVNRKTGQNLTFFRMLFRETIGKFISTAIFLIGFIWIIIDNENAGWHDKISNSAVVEIVGKTRKAVCHPDDDEFFVKG
jgi:uncharacterized RDD family membrane protein YckC